MAKEATVRIMRHLLQPDVVQKSFSVCERARILASNIF
jgi:hypothetical protein